MVTQTYNQPGISKTLDIGSGSDPYAALDRFGRNVDHRWNNGSADLVSFEYGYDRGRCRIDFDLAAAGNRLSERNLINTGSNPSVDSLFGFDELNRMTDFDSGLLNTAGDAISSPELAQNFTLDETGNFTDFVQTGTDSVTQSRSHNAVNEITNIAETAGAAWVTPTHDDAGNMTAIPQPADLTDGYDATWDGWNRLVSLSDNGNLVANYQYDGLNRRIVVTDYRQSNRSSSGQIPSSSSNGSPSIETRHVYYSLQSQAIEERVGLSTDAERQFVWNVGYVDDLILRDRDSNASGAMNERLYALSDLRYSVVALANATGTILERYKYDGLGNCTVLTPTFASRSSSVYDWQFRYTGRREDLNTGLLYFRARYYHAQLGRFISRDPLGFVDGMSQYRAYFVPGGMDPMGLKEESGPGSAGGGAESSSLCPEGWEFVSGPSKDPIDETMWLGPSPVSTGSAGELYNFYFRQTGFEAAGIQLRTNSCGEATSGSLSIAFEKSSSFDIGADITLYEVFSVGASGGTSSTSSVGASINVELPDTTDTEYLAVGVVEYLVNRTEQWYVKPERLRKVTYGKKGYFPRINYTLCKRECCEAEQSDETADK